MSGIDGALLITTYYASIRNTASSSNISEFLTPMEVEKVVTLLDNDRIVLAAESYLIALPTMQNQDSITGVLFEENYRSQTILTSNQAVLLNSSFGAAFNYDNQSVANASRLSALVINDPSDYQKITDSSDLRLISAVIITSLKPKTFFDSRANVSLIFQPTDSSIPTNQLVCAYYDQSSSSWNSSSCTLPVMNVGRYECSCSDVLQSVTVPTSTPGKYQLSFQIN